MTKSDLGRLVAGQRLVGFDRFERAGCSVEGYLLDFSDEWLLIHSLVDFHLDGFELIRPRDVRRIRPRARNFGRILVAEGITKDQIATSPTLNLRSTELLFKDLKASGNIIIADCEYSDEEDTYLYIGEVERVNKLSISMRWFDVGGYWQPRPVNIPFSAVSTIRIDCEYSRVYSSYLRSKSETSARPQSRRRTH